MSRRSFWTPTSTSASSRRPRGRSSAYLPGDIGRPLADLSPLTIDADLAADAQTVLQTFAPIEREVGAGTGLWYIRRILPYRTQDDAVEGVVITFTDITERRRIADALKAAERQAQLANLAKSRFLAAASHDLRQPLQTLALVQGLLAKSVEGEKAQKLVARLDETLAAISGMLNTLLDINQIEAGTVRANFVSFPIKDLLVRLSDEFAYHAEAKRLQLHVVPSGLSVHSDPRLLEQMIRNLLANAVKYTERGKVLLGCRRRGGKLAIEIWDTGIGIPEAELDAIFDEYHQLDNGARERSRGLGLGLAIVRRLANLLGHEVSVRSRLDRGSVFAVDVALAADEVAPTLLGERRGQGDEAAVEGLWRAGTILIVEDDPEIRGLLELFLKDEGHHTAAAADGAATLDMVARGAIRPDLILTDYNLPNGMDGLQVVARLRKELRSKIAAIVLTGDISTDTLREIVRQNCAQLSKPVKLKVLAQAVQRLLPISSSAVSPHDRHPAEAPNGPEAPVIFLVDDDSHIRGLIRSVLEDEGWTVEDYADCEAFLEAYRPGREGCLLVDAYLPGMSGLELLQRLNDAG